LFSPYNFDGIAVQKASISKRPLTFYCPTANIAFFLRIEDNFLHFSFICPRIMFYIYLCGCGWLYGTYFGRFWGFMADYKAVAMGQVVPLGRAT
jgi:hypothetical protein